MRILGCACLAFLFTAMCPAQDTNFSAGPQYLTTFGSPLFLHPIATPSLSFESMAPQGGTIEAIEPQASPEQSQAVSNAMDVQRQAYLPTIYYGVPTATAVEISLSETGGGELPAVVPASIVETGVTELTDAETLGQRGYGITLGEAAQRWKNRKSTAPHVYTNSDIERLRGGN